MKNVAKTELVFHETTLTTTNRKGQIWFTATDLATALQYANVKSITNIYNENSDEFTSAMSEVIESVTSGNLRKRVRLFSLRGAHLLAMFSRTPVAKEFRRWVLDILERNSQTELSPIEKRLNLRCPECGSQAKIIQLKKLHRMETVMHVQCANPSCGITHHASFEYKHFVKDEIHTSAAVTELIGTMTEYEKATALGLLLRS